MKGLIPPVPKISREIKTLTTVDLFDNIEGSVLTPDADFLLTIPVMYEYFAKVYKRILIGPFEPEGTVLYVTFSRNATRLQVLLRGIT